MSNSQEETPSQSSKTATPLSGQELIKLVEVAAEGVGNELALKKLESLPREDLIQALSRIRASLEEDNRLRVQIAFVFCYLNHEYLRNRSIIVSVFSKASHYKGFYADDAVAMIYTLIERGDKELLQVVYAHTGEADAALAEGIEDIIDEQIRRDPERFLFSLKDQPARVRRDVYNLIDLSEDTSNKFKDYLSAAASRPETMKVAKELLRVLRRKSHERG